MNWVLDNLELIGGLTLVHLRQSAIPIVVSFVIAVPLGWLAWRYTSLRGTTLTTVGLLYTIPSLGLFAVLAAAFGIPLLSEVNLIVALTIYAVAIMTRSVTDGLVSVDPVTREAAVAVGFGAWRRFWTVEFPLAGPVLLAGLRVTASSTISLATVGYGDFVPLSRLARSLVIAEVLAGQLYLAAFVARLVGALGTPPER